MNTDNAISKQVALECTITFAKILDKPISFDELTMLSNKFHNWIMKGRNKDELIIRQSALRRAVMYKEIASYTINTSDQLISTAELIINYINK